MNKLLAFDYVTQRLWDWYRAVADINEQNDLSKLKVTKLLFFVAATSTAPSDAGLLTIFDNFFAMPYGHVESDIQDVMDQSIHYEITKQGLSYKAGVVAFDETLIDQDLKVNIDKAIDKLKSINNSLILYAPFQLVDLSHKWQSWRTVFSLAKRNGKFSMKIPQEMIMSEPKIFF